MNKVELSGRLCADCKFNFTPTGFPIAKFNLAVDRYKPKEGFQKTDFIPIVLMGKSAEEKADELKKGKLVKVPKGELHINKPQEDGGKYWTEVITWEVEFIERTKDGHVSEPQQFQETSDDMDGIDLDQLPF